MKKQILVILMLCVSGMLIAQQNKATYSKSAKKTTSSSEEQQQDFLSEKKAPQYNGGKQAMFKFINENMKYPADAKEKKVEGDVQLKFIVAVDGSITNVEVVQGIFPSIDAEAVRVVKKMPKWIPGKYGNVNASMKSSLIIGFHLTE